MNAAKLSRTMKIDPSEALSGMVLSEPVLDSQGGMLVASGTVLTDSLLTSLTRRGIPLVSVVDDSITEAELQAQREQAQIRLDRLFRNAASGSATARLKSAIMKYRMEMLK